MRVVGDVDPYEKNERLLVGATIGCPLLYVHLIHRKWSPFPSLLRRGRLVGDGALDIPSKAARKCARSGARKCGALSSYRYVWDNVM